MLNKLTAAVAAAIALGLSLEGALFLTHRRRTEGWSCVNCGLTKGDAECEGCQHLGDGLIGKKIINLMGQGHSYLEARHLIWETEQ